MSVRRRRIRVPIDLDAQIAEAAARHENDYTSYVVYALRAHFRRFRKPAPGAGSVDSGSLHVRGADRADFVQARGSQGTQTPISDAATNPVGRRARRGVSA
jgi:hypothetical protein